MFDRQPLNINKAVWGLALGSFSCLNHSDEQFNHSIGGCKEGEGGGFPVPYGLEDWRIGDWGLVE